MAAIGSTPFERRDEAEGFLIVTSAADKRLVDIHDRRPLVLLPEAAREWMRQDIGGKEAEEIAADGAARRQVYLARGVARRGQCEKPRIIFDASFKLMKNYCKAPRLIEYAIVNKNTI
jgi:putative SOS response-associated peptidase YedK